MPKRREGQRTIERNVEAKTAREQKGKKERFKWARAGSMNIPKIRFWGETQKTKAKAWCEMKKWLTRPSTLNVLNGVEVLIV
jgi:hypothetical protein